MAERTVLMVGTRKGLFLLESDDARRDWAMRGPFCEGWPIYHAVHDAEIGRHLRRRRERVARRRRLAEHRPRRDLGAVQRGARLRRDGELKLSKISGLAAAHGRVLAGAEAAGIFESRDGGATWSLLSTLDGQPGRDDVERSREPAAGPPRHAGDPAAPGRPGPVLGRSSRASASSRRPTTALPGRRATRACARTGRASEPSVGFCVHKLVMAPTDRDRLYQQNHCGMHRSDDGGRSWTEITEGLPTDFGFAAAVAPARPRHLLRDPARSRPRPLHARRTRRRLADAATPARRGSGSTTGLPQRDALPRRAARGHGDRHATTCRASTSAPAPARCSRAPTRARAGARSRATCPAISSVEVAVVGVADGRRAPPGDAAAAVRRPAAPGRRRGRDGGRGDRPAGRALARAARPAVRARAARCGATSTSTSTSERAGLDDGARPRLAAST